MLHDKTWFLTLKNVSRASVSVIQKKAPDAVWALGKNG